MGHENQIDCILRKVFPFLFRVQLRYLPSSEVFLYHLFKINGTKTDNFAIWQFKNCQIAKGPSSQMESIKTAVCNPTHTAAKSFTKSSCLSITPNPQLIYVKFPAQSYVLTYLEMLTFWKCLQAICQDFFFIDLRTLFIGIHIFVLLLNK